MEKDKKKILVIDDDVNILKAMQCLLESNGYIVITVSDGGVAFEIALKEVPDLIILDLILPDVNGYEIYQKFTVEKKLKDIPVIILTGQGTARDIRQGMDIGAAAYVAKPFDPGILLGIIKALLGEPPQEHYTGAQ